MDAGEGEEVSYAFYPGSGRCGFASANVVNAAVMPLWRDGGRGRAAAQAASRARRQYSAAVRASQSSAPGHLLLEGGPAVPGGTAMPPPRAGRHAFVAAMRDRVVPALRAFGPDLILVSAGFDAGRSDVGNTRNDGFASPGSDLSPDDFHEMTRLILAVSQRCCPGRVVSLLEGGYGRWVLREAPRPASAPLPEAPARRSSRRAAAAREEAGAAAGEAEAEPGAGDTAPAAGGRPPSSARRRSPRHRGGARAASRASVASPGRRAAARAGTPAAAPGNALPPQSPAAERPQSAAPPRSGNQQAPVADAGAKEAGASQESESESDEAAEPPALGDGAAAAEEPPVKDEVSAPERVYSIDRDVLAMCCASHIRALLDGTGPIHRPDA